MKKYHLLILLLAAISCKETITTGFLDKPVVESYLYADESPTVNVSKLIALSSDMTYSDMDINKLNVTITDKTSGKAWPLTAQGSGAYSNNALTISAGRSYQLSFPWNGTTVTATTEVPPQPQNLLLSATNVSISTGVGGPGGTPIDITWDNPGQDFYLIYVKNVESTKVAIDTHFSGNDFFRNQPTNADHYELNTRSFKYYGLHRIILYRIQPEYVLFFQENSNSSLSISEIKANIENGMGIFTGLNSASAYIYVGKP